MSKPRKRRVVLRTIPKPESGTRTVLDPKIGEVLPVIKGAGDIDLLCGNCKAILVEGISQGQIRNIVIHCPICRFYNNVP